MSLSHAAALQRSISGPESERFKSLVDRLVGVTAAYGELFVELLSWSERILSAEPGWDHLALDDRLALPWMHADRVLGILLGRRIEPKAARENFARIRPERSVGSLFGPQPHHRDRAASKNLTAQALLAYLLANAFGDEPLSLLLTGAAGLETFVPGEPSDPQRWLPFLFPRSIHQPNAMGTFVGRIPVGLLGEGEDLERIRDAAVQHSLSLVEGDFCSTEGWLVLFASTLPTQFRPRNEFQGLEPVSGELADCPRQGSPGVRGPASDTLLRSCSNRGS